MEEMVIQSDNFDLSDLISDTVKELIGRLLTTFAEVNGPVDRQDMDAKVSRLLQDLGLSNRNE